MDLPAAALLGETSSRVVHQDMTHCLRGYGKEMTAILPTGVRLAHQSQVGLVNECCWLERGFPAPAAYSERLDGEAHHRRVAPVGARAWESPSRNFRSR